MYTKPFITIAAILHTHTLQKPLLCRPSSSAQRSGVTPHTVCTRAYLVAVLSPPPPPPPTTAKGRANQLRRAVLSAPSNHSVRVNAADANRRDNTAQCGATHGGGRKPQSSKPKQQAARPARPVRPARYVRQLCQSIVWGRKLGDHSSSQSPHRLGQDSIRRRGTPRTIVISVLVCEKT
eukprot:COSAG02_NODE_890_length_16155_cov_63.407885_10_plen_179_part_00